MDDRTFIAGLVENLAILLFCILAGAFVVLI